MKFIKNLYFYLKYFAFCPLHLHNLSYTDIIQARKEKSMEKKQKKKNVKEANEQKPVNKAIGKRVQQLRTVHLKNTKYGRLTQGKFLKTLNINTASSALSAWEVGKTSVPSTIKTLLCCKFNVSREWIDFGTGPIFEPDMTKQTSIDYIVSIYDKINDESAKNFILSTIKQFIENHPEVLEVNEKDQDPGKKHYRTVSKKPIQ